MRHALFLVLLVLFMMVVWGVYSPGLSGTMLFDDDENLKIINTVGGVHSVESLIEYLLAGQSSVIGRPISMASFLVDGQFWPLDEYRLKRTNLLIHMVNALLVLWLTLLIVKRACPNLSFIKTTGLAFLVALLWALNPLQVSTVSYIIQRMAELAALFVFSGLIIFLKCEERFWRSDRSSSLGVRVKILLGLTIGFGVALLLAVLSKENGLLLCLFALICNGYFHTCHKSDAVAERAWRAWVGVCLVLPLALFLVYCLYTYQFFTLGFNGRDFNSLERILTESRIIFIYLKVIFLPHLDQMGLFAGDSIALSTSLFEPITTLFALMALMLIIFAVFFYRKRYPLISFGFAFFLCGHVMESTFLPLELYFEHRNYIPQFGLWIALLGVGLSLVQWVSTKLLLFFSTALLLIYSGVTYQVSTLWGDPLALAQRWYSNHISIRTTEFFAVELDHLGHRQAARDVLSESMKKHYPYSLSLNLAVDYMDCLLQREGFRFDPNRYTRIMEKTDRGRGWIATIEQMLKVFGDNEQCSGVTPDALKQLIHMAFTSAALQGDGRMQWHAYRLLSKIAMNQRILDESIVYLDKACEIICYASIRVRQALLLSSAGLYAEAERYLIMADSMMTPVGALREPEVKAAIVALRDQIEQAMASQQE